MTVEAKPTTSAASDAERAAIEATVADYYLGWFDGDPDRMARALHPELLKRGWLHDESGALTIDVDSFESMVDWTRKGQGRTDDPATRRYDVRAIEVHADIASACVYAVPYVDYLHLVRTDKGWRIFHALWQTP